MLGYLSEKMQNLTAKLSGKRVLTEENIDEAVRDVRMALLEADVNYGVAKKLVKSLKEKALGDAVIKSVTPGQQFIKVVHDELKSLMGTGESVLNLQNKPSVIMMCGLQGSGKTTHCAKLAQYLIKTGKVKTPLLAACDLQRPAAVEQLKILGKQINVPVFSIDGESNPLIVAKAALKKAKEENHDLLIVDTAGRLHIDGEMMEQLEALRDLVNPDEVLFVVNSTTGQDAVNIAAEFNRRIELTGTILTMLDGNTRGGAAISIREVTGKPLLFEGIGEKIGDIQVFNPESMADRILGMGDTINLVKKAQEHITEDDAKDLEKKLRTATFTYDDYLSQISMVRKMGSFKSLLGMIPGIPNLNNLNIDDKEFLKIESIIRSMTPNERKCKVELSVPRRRRVAEGSGTKMDDVNKLEKLLKQMKSFFKKMPNLNQLQKLMGGSRWG